MILTGVFADIAKAQFDGNYIPLRTFITGPMNVIRTAGVGSPATPRVLASPGLVAGLTWKENQLRDSLQLYEGSPAVHDADAALHAGGQPELSVDEKAILDRILVRVGLYTATYGDEELEIDPNTAIPLGCK
jgi:hypothetical protein